MKWNAQVSIRIRRTDDSGVVADDKLRSFTVCGSDATELARSIAKRVENDCITMAKSMIKGESQ